MKIESNELNALTLIEKVIDFQSMTPDSQKWELEDFEHNPPRLVRLKQISALLQLYLPEIYTGVDLKLDILKMTNGDFIFKRDFQVYREVVLDMEQLTKSSMNFLEEIDRWDSSHLQFHFERLFDLKKQIEHLKSFNSDIMECSYQYYYSYLLSKKIIKPIDSGPVDVFLQKVIDPEGKVYLKEELIHNNKYPPDDLIDIDIDWM
ncbi:MAG: hypothetical protein U0W24_16720 [Bacteroidales bacterium]